MFCIKSQGHGRNMIGNSSQNLRKGLWTVLTPGQKYTKISVAHVMLITVWTQSGGFYQVDKVAHSVGSVTCEIGN